MPHSGCVTVSTYMEDNAVVMKVKDEGEGIRDDIVQRLGTPFLTTKDLGTGLGLAVCFAIARRHQATIDFTTGATGTSFFVRFKQVQKEQTKA